MEYVYGVYGDETHNYNNTINTFDIIEFETMNCDRLWNVWKINKVFYYTIWANKHIEYIEYKIYFHIILYSAYDSAPLLFAVSIEIYSI